MRLYAISDLHIGHPINAKALEQISSYQDSWLILAGDIGEKDEHFHFALSILSKRFAKIIWTPGNHDLWTMPNDKNPKYGEEKYFHLVNLCRDYGVLTPEDEFASWQSADGQSYVIAPVFTLYDYSFRPEHVEENAAIEWAKQTNVLCRDEQVWHNDPYKNKQEWCSHRCQITKNRLEEAKNRGKLILVSHFPLIQNPTHRLLLIPRFSIWCGTTKTANWHCEYPVELVIYGHLHIRSCDIWDGVRFEEVSLGYPHQWNQDHSIDYYLREILI